MKFQTNEMGGLFNRSAKKSLRKNRKRMRQAVAAGDAARVAKLSKKIAKDKKKIKSRSTGSILKKALPVAAIAFPVLATAVKAIDSAKQAKRQADAVKKQEKQIEREEQQQRSQFVADLVRQGVPQPAAEKILQLVESGMPIERAHQQVMPSVAPVVSRPAVMPHPETPAPALAPVSKPSVVAQEDRFVNDQYAKWLRQWNPQMYAEVVSEVSSQGVSGLFDDFMSTVTAVGEKILPTYYQQQILKAQLDRARKGLPPAPTAQLAPAAAAAAQAAGQPVPSSSGMTTMLAIAAAAGIGIFALSGGGRRRR